MYSFAMRRTFSLVSRLMLLSFLFITFETVETETPASFAMSRIVILHLLFKINTKKDHKKSVITYLLVIINQKRNSEKKYII